MIKLICRVLLRCGPGRGGIWDRSTVKRLLLSVTYSVGNDVVSESGWRELAWRLQATTTPHPTSQITSQWEKHYTGHCWSFDAIMLISAGTGGPNWCHLFTYDGILCNSFGCISVYAALLGSHWYVLRYPVTLYFFGDWISRIQKVCSDPYQWRPVQCLEGWTDTSLHQERHTLSQSPRTLFSSSLTCLLSPSLTHSSSLLPLQLCSRLVIPNHGYMDPKGYSGRFQRVLETILLKPMKTCWKQF